MLIEYFVMRKPFTFFLLCFVGLSSLSTMWHQLKYIFLIIWLYRCYTLLFTQSFIFHQFYKMSKLYCSSGSINLQGLSLGTGVWSVQTSKDCRLAGNEPVNLLLIIFYFHKKFLKVPLIHFDALELWNLN